MELNTVNVIYGDNNAPTTPTALQVHTHLCPNCKGYRLVQSNDDERENDFSICAACNGTGRKNVISFSTSSMEHPDLQDNLMGGSVQLTIIEDEKRPELHFPLDGRVFLMSKISSEPDAHSSSIPVEEFLAGERPCRLTVQPI